MKTNMLEYAKIILSKVRFDKRIFWKEYRKHRKCLSPSEVSDLKAWVKSQGVYQINQ